ncbi:exported hypothetical protein [Verrucomicrobia bacterium]|nr:exported hypothetical protein [Verrucomicrobiota bacterium]
MRLAGLAPPNPAPSATTLPVQAPLASASDSESAPRPVRTYISSFLRRTGGTAFFNHGSHGYTDNLKEAIRNDKIMV